MKAVKFNHAFNNYSSGESFAVKNFWSIFSKKVFFLTKYFSHKVILPSILFINVHYFG